MKGWLATLAVAVSLSALLFPSQPPPLLEVAQRLVDLDGEAGEAQTLETLEGWSARVQEVEVDGDRRPSWVLRAPGRWRFGVTVPPAGSLRFAFAQTAMPPRPVSIRLIQTGDGQARLYSERWGGDPGWNERRVELPLPAGRRRELDLVLEGAGARMALGQPAVLGLPQADRPNVVIYLIDCLRADHVGAYGYPLPTTPNLDKLAKDGIVFERATACSAWTKPSVGCLFTSLRPLHHGAQTIYDTLDPTTPTLAEAFHSAGYTTAAWVANPMVSSRAVGLVRGFGHVVKTEKLPQQLGLNDLAADAARITRTVVPWIESNSDRRMLLFIHSLDLHASYRRRAPFARLFLTPAMKGDARQIGLYDSELAYNDRELGKLVAALKRLGLYDRTLLVVMADHGEEFGEHGTYRHGRSLYETLLHVPLIIKPPGARRRARRTEALAGLVDIGPTLLDYAGLAPLPGAEGTSLRAAIEGRGTPRTSPVFAEQLGHQEILYSSRGERYKAIERLFPEPRSFVFDLSRDPQERHNLIPEVPEQAKGLRSDLAARLVVAQGGYHVSAGGSAPGVRLRLEMQAEGRIDRVQRFSPDQWDEQVLSADRRTLTLTFTTPEGRGLHLLVRTSPPGSRVRLHVSANGRAVSPADVLLGPRGSPAQELPVWLDPEAIGASFLEARRMLRESSGLATVWYLRGHAPEVVSLDPETERELRALGYVE